MRRLEGKTAIVTGGSSGIGRAIARLFAAEGAVVVIADVTEEAIEGGPPVCEVIESEGGRAVFHRTDVSRADEVEHLVATTAARFGRIDVLVNNAVLRAGKALLETSEEDWDRVMAVSLKGAYLCARAAVRRMLVQPITGEARGRIVNIASQHGMVSAPEDFAYGVSKAGIVYMTRQIAADYAKEHIVCNAVAPGKILTGKAGRAVEPRWIEYSHQRTPMPRLGRPDDVARAALFLASDEATFITGHNLMVDGGWMAA
ncbi:SDR family NAD(P)-dependent oxidoreductase [Marinivivus vitaminiproducens]|uniref:SDR family NAD(P)-dependent oxidoreductase n=1 Tax=Marinivivus vitaminiproducens TaxID=3035935 RepID=UPI0027A430F5|nr:glucose 1-dehydrogenase [Geminicoccaceae bacterium SCSIO 64248]